MSKVVTDAKSSLTNENDKSSHSLRELLEWCHACFVTPEQCEQVLFVK